MDKTRDENPYYLAVYDRRNVRKTQMMIDDSDVPVFGVRGRGVGDVSVDPAKLDGLDLVEEVSVEKCPEVGPALDGVPHGVGEEGLFPPGLGPLAHFDVDGGVRGHADIGRVRLGVDLRTGSYLLFHIGDDDEKTALDLDEKQMNRQWLPDVTNIKCR